MSASYVRSKVEQWCGEAEQATGVAFHKTINLDVDPQEDVWFTVEFISLYKEGLLCKRGYMEQGVVRVVFIGQPGIGWDDTILALESVIPVLMGKVDPSQRLELTDDEPLVEESLGSAEPNYMVSVSINYIHKL
jgi:hypothetical protein